MSQHVGVVHGPAVDHEEQEALRRAAEWHEVEAQAAFQELVAAKRRFLIPATIFFIIYYFALPVLVGYFPSLMSINVIGQINIAYLFALSQFFMAWTLMWLYVRRARKWDAMAAKIADAVKGAKQ